MNTITTLDKDGNEKTFDVIFTFDSEETGKSYIVYTDDPTDEEGNTQVYASTYDKENEHSKLLPIETEKEWNIINAILEAAQESVKEESE